MSESEDSQVFDQELDALVESWVSPQKSHGTVDHPILSLPEHAQFFPLSPPVAVEGDVSDEPIHPIPPQHKCVVCLLSDDQVRPAQSRFSDACHCVECTFHDACLQTYVDSKMAGSGTIWLGQGNVPPTVACPICRQHRNVVESPSVRVGRYSEMMAVEAAKWLSRVYITRVMIHCWWAFNLVTGLTWKRPLFANMSWGDVMVASWLIVSMFEVSLKELHPHRGLMMWGGELVWNSPRRIRTLRVSWFHITLIDQKWSFPATDDEIAQITPWVAWVSKVWTIYQTVTPVLCVWCIVSSTPLPFVTDCLPFTLWLCHHAWPIWTCLCGACGLLWVHNPLVMCKLVMEIWVYIFQLMFKWLQRRGYHMPQGEALQPEIMAWASVFSNSLY
jgi:hypothetical protein